ncbi:MAG: secondary thiamine-phosphate synthase enzyme YjbQ [Cyanobacteria bacterium P01_G01_bin.4]
MPITHHIVTIETGADLQLYNLTPHIEKLVAESSISNGHVLVFSRHTTTALAVNEYEERLLEDIKTYLNKLAPKDDRYLHNDLHLRPNIPDDEPENAHSHLMAITLSNSEMIPIVDGQLALGTYQSVLLFELDGPRRRTVSVQICGE